jgi:DNA-binding CsgD family transcriptional regulator
VSISYQAYDDALGKLYGANASANGLGAFLLMLEDMIDADMASIVAYDDIGVRASYGVCTRHHAISSSRVAAWQGDMAMRRLAHHNFPRPVRLSELASYDSLSNQAWYRAQFESFGLRHCVFQDIDRGTSKFRMIAQRGAGRTEFGRDEAELFARLGEHLRMAAPLLASPAFVNADGSPDVQVFDLDDRMRLGAARQWSGDASEMLSRRYDLTPSEVRVALAFAKGRSIKAVSADLEVSVNTVKVHLRHIYSKLDLRGLPELVSLLSKLQA